MKAPIRNLDHYGLLSSLSVVVLTCIVGLTGVFQRPNEMVNDSLLRFGPGQRNSNKILLVYAPEEIFQPDQFEELKQAMVGLAELRPAAIGLATPTSEAQLANLCQLGVEVPIVFGTQVESLIKNNLRWQDLSKFGLHPGCLDRKLDQLIYREHFHTLPIDSENASSFVSCMASQYGTKVETNHAFGIRFVGGSQSLPHISFQDVIEGNIVSELVEDRMVIIGPIEAKTHGLVTPTTSGSQRMSYLEVQGHALHTLISNNQVTRANSWVSVAVLLLVSIMACQIFRQVSTNYLVAGLVYVLLAWTLTSWLVLHFVSFKLPVATGLFAITGVLLACVKTRFQSFRELIDNWQLMRQTGGQSDWRSEEKDTWTLVSDSIYQILNPKRVVLMELKPGATHLCVTKSIHCTEKDIFERRRDFNREPYRDAVELGAAMKIQNRQFFHIEEESDCLEYIAPLLILSELVGFIVLEMDREAVKNWDDFENFLTQFASEMAVLVNKYQLLQQNENRRWHFVRNMKELPEDQQKRTLFQSEIEHYNLENLLGDAFETIQTAGAICDVFGRVIRTNLKMVELLQRHDLSIDETDSVSLLVTMTGWQKDDCRKIFRQCVVEGQNQHIFLPQEDESDAPRVLYLEPLSKGDDESELPSRCASIQIIEGRIFEESKSWQQEFIRRNVEQASSELNELRELAVRLNLNNEQGQKTVDESTLNQILQSVVECQALLGSQFCEEPNDIVLVDALSIWNACVHRVRPKLEARCISLTSRMDATEHRVCANPFLLERLFETAIDCVSHDVGEGSELLVSTDEADTKRVFRLTHAGDKAPLDQLRRSLDLGNAESPSDHEFLLAVLEPSQVDKLREMNRWLCDWQASMNIHCSEDYRISFEIVLESELPDQINILGSPQKPNSTGLPSFSASDSE